MSIEAIRSAFMAAGKGVLRLTHAGLACKGSRQVLTFAGWHADGTPFAMATAPFDGHPVERAAQAALAIVAAHGQPAATGGKTTMSQKGSGLARLMGGLKSLDADADALAERLDAAMASLQSEMATTTQIVGNVETSVNDLRAVNALYSNGAPSPTPVGMSASGQSGKHLLDQSSC
jgi:hypothetical protein